MNKSCERNMEPKQDANKTDACLGRTFTALTVDDVYEIAKLVGSEVEKLIDSFGKESVEGLVPKIVKVLELLESFAARNHVHSSKEEELLKAFETLQVQKQKKRAVKESEDDSNNNEIRDLQQKEQKWRKASEDLQAKILQLQEENQELLHQLQSHSKGDQVQRQEREVMLKLKEVVDKQRDEIRAKVLENSSLSKEVEALQEQLERFMKMNGELRHKQSVVQAQVKSAVERKAELETDLREKHKEMERLTVQLEKARNASTAAQQASSGKQELDLKDKLIIDLKDPNRPCFTKQEVRDMLFERNELKANLFLVQEELAYYQREILNDERCPGFLLEAVRSAIKKQRTVIKAKMLGIAEDQCSSDEDDRGPLFERKEGTDCTDGKAPESRIRNLFGFLTRSSSGKSPSHQNTPTGSSWEIIVPDDEAAPPPEEAERLHSP